MIFKHPIICYKQYSGHKVKKKILRAGIYLFSELAPGKEFDKMRGMSPGSTLTGNYLGATLIKTAF